MTRAITGILFLLLLCACQETLTATVTRFHTLPVPPGGHSFVVMAQGLQTGNLEFQHIAGLVSAALQAHGYQPVAPADASKADLVVLLQYGPAGSRSQVIEYAAPPRPWWGFPPYDVYTLYSQFLEVDMFDGPAWRRGEQRMVFQGRAFTESGVREFNVVVPYLAQALFERFPGINGETIRVRVPVT